MPDNRRIVLSISRGSEPNRLYVADTASGEFSLLSSGTTMQVLPAVSPDGTRAAFTEATTDFDVLQVDVGTGEVSPLVATTRNEEMPAWAMHAPAMAYVTDRAGAPEIWLHEPGRPTAPSSLPMILGGHADFLSPLLSPDGAASFTRASSGRAVRALARRWAAARPSASLTRRRPSIPGGWSPDGAWFVLDLQREWHAVAKVRTTGNAASRSAAQRRSGRAWLRRGTAVVARGD
jgi:Tol biopolymer transport system component